MEGSLCHPVIEVRVLAIPCWLGKRHVTSKNLRALEAQWVRACRVPAGPNLNRVKRSFGCAQRRALQQGWCIYKGRVLLPQDLRAEAPPSRPMTYTSSQLAQHKPEGRRASVFSWNVGGLTSARYSEFMHWAYEQQFGITMLQGTLWKEESTWTAYGVVHVSSQ